VADVGASDEEVVTDVDDDGEVLDSVLSSELHPTSEMLRVAAANPAVVAAINFFIIGALLCRS
jgi:hypothetical protein